MITAFITSLLAFINFKIAMFTIKQRRRSETAYVIGDGEDKILCAAVSAHSNFVSYVPLFLILFYLMEEQFKIHHFILIPWGLLFVAARYTHFLGLTKKEHEEKPNFNYRIRSMQVTIFSLLIAAAINMVFALIQMYKDYIYY